MIERANSEPAVGIEPTTAPYKKRHSGERDTGIARVADGVRARPRAENSRSRHQKRNAPAICPLALSGGNTGWAA